MRAYGSAYTDVKMFGLTLFSINGRTSATAKMNDTSYESPADFHGYETKKNILNIEFLNGKLVT
jgi:hypothetical protein